jgi:AcrR family transcriptional regulator
MTTTPPLRRDAQRNRERLIRAAREIFAARGLDVPLDEVARAAGVSIGTLYNRFPSRSDLVDAVFADREVTVARLAEAALEMEPPWDGFVHFVEQICRLLAADRGYNDLSARRLPHAAPPRGHTLMTELIARAQASGELRADFTLADMAFVTWSITRTIEATAAVRPDAWRRHLALLLDGLRAAAAHPLPGPPLGDDQVAGAVDGACS